MDHQTQISPIKSKSQLLIGRLLVIEFCLCLRLFVRLGCNSSLCIHVFMNLVGRAVIDLKVELFNNFLVVIQ